jgi:hypothetical protein
MMILTIPDVPPSPNELRRKYKSPYAYKKLRESWEWGLVCAAAPHHRDELRKQAQRPGKLWVQITVHHNRVTDEDNLVGSQKPVLDALVRTGYLANDSPDRLQLLPAEQVKCKKTEARTVIKIGAVD